MENDDQQNKFNEYGLIYGALLIACCLTLFRCWFNLKVERRDYYTFDPWFYQCFTTFSLAFLVGLFAVVLYSVYSTRPWWYRSLLAIGIFTAICWTLSKLPSERFDKFSWQLGLILSDCKAAVLFFFIPTITVGMFSRFISNIQMRRWKKRTDAIEFGNRNPADIRTLYGTCLMVIFLYVVGKTSSLFSTDLMMMRIQLHENVWTIVAWLTLTAFSLSIAFVAVSRIEHTKTATIVMLLASLTIVLAPWIWWWLDDWFADSTYRNTPNPSHPYFHTLVYPILITTGFLGCYILLLSLSRTLPFSYSRVSNRSRIRSSEDSVDNKSISDLQLGNWLVAPTVLIGFALCVWLIPQSEFLRNQLIQLTLPN